MAGAAVEDHEAIRVAWTVANSETTLEWYSTTPVWVSWTSLDGLVGQAMYSDGTATFASARKITLKPDTGGMLFLVRVSYCLPSARSW